MYHAIFLHPSSFLLNFHISLGQVFIDENVTFLQLFPIYHDTLFRRASHKFNNYRYCSVPSFMKIMYSQNFFFLNVYLKFCFGKFYKILTSYSFFLFWQILFLDRYSRLNNKILAKIQVT